MEGELEMADTGLEGRVPDNQKDHLKMYNLKYFSKR